MIVPSNTTPKKKKSSKKPHAAFILVMVALVAVVAVDVYFIANSPKAEDADNPQSPNQGGNIAEVTPVAPVTTEVHNEPPPPVDPNARPTKPGEVVNGYVMLPSGRIHKPTGVVTNRVATYGKSKYSIFENRSDNEIAGILMMQPGDALVGTKRYDKWFTQQFLKSIETPIIASEDDEPWQAELKDLVKQARLGLKEAYDNGEDIAAIMTESRQQLQDLGKYKQAIRQLYAQNMKECNSDVELAELQRAVNIMLEEKGCAPMNFTPLTKMNLKKDHADE